MITNEQAAKMFERPTIEAVPTDMKRLVIPAYGFAGADDAKRQEWGVDGPFMEDVKGLVFKNPKDNADQVLKQKDGVLLCYDAPGRKEKIEQYLKNNPGALMTKNKVNQFIDYLSKMLSMRAEKLICGIAMSILRQASKTRRPKKTSNREWCFPR